jgi:hypothetical protein
MDAGHSRVNTFRCDIERFVRISKSCCSTAGTMVGPNLHLAVIMECAWFCGHIRSFDEGLVRRSAGSVGIRHGVPRKRSPLRTIEGRVYARLDNVRGPVDPVAGALVSNNWDQTTATTDQSGRFVVRVRRVAADEFMVLRVESGGKTACQRLAGTATGRDVLEIFLDGGRFGNQRCSSR